MEEVIGHEVKQTLQAQLEEVKRSGTHKVDSVSLEKLRSGLMFMTCLSGYVHACVRMYVCMYVCTYVCMYISMCVCTYVSRL